jgi:hypothetical protein
LIIDERFLKPRSSFSRTFHRLLQRPNNENGEAVYI